MPTLQELGIDRLSVEERIALAQAIWDSLPVDATRGQLSAAQREELDRRQRDLAERPEDLVPWEQFQADSRTRWQP